MALQINSPSSFTNKPYHLLHHLHIRTKTHFTIKAQSPSESPKPTVEVSETTVPPKKTSSPGQGFGSSPSSSTKEKVTSGTDKKKGRSKRERASIIRRSPVAKPAFTSEEDEVKAKERGKNESAFLLSWLGLGGVILIQGIALAASGTIT
ncbi:hypothetical protein FNV43_RR24225 [Rhamnella rubrinervis]|uniref:Uncharacterized protein n=1 Tax=Rhamnella rubrinervis TaxID=2594499 RepID=A0A8K0GQI8_9ROSA|nr:hypothetical protein FNV43_RR24225 [Rhamnella rubrinervis]